MGRPAILKKSIRTIITVEENDFKLIKKHLGSKSFAQFVREMIKMTLTQEHL